MIHTGETRCAGVMGWPVAHSRSPRLQGYWLEHYGIDGAYLPLPVRPETLGAALRALPLLGFRGCNLTLPHKEAAAAHLDALSDAARAIGAVNMVTVRDDGSLHGDNTDAFGFIAHLNATAGDWRGRAPAVVLGAGGAARAVIVALLEAGVPELRCVNRTPSRSAALVEAFGPRVRPAPWRERSSALAGAGLLVNTTSLGMSGQPALDLDLARLPRTAPVYDLVYAPLETALLARARALGNPAVDGLGMLLHQARPGFAAWFGVEPEVTPEVYAFAAEGL